MCCSVLKKGAVAGLTLYDIASIITRSDIDIPSQLEDICVQAAGFSFREYESYGLTCVVT